MDSASGTRLRGRVRVPGTPVAPMNADVSGAPDDRTDGAPGGVRDLDSLAADRAGRDRVADSAAPDSALPPVPGSGADASSSVPDLESSSASGLEGTTDAAAPDAPPDPWSTPSASGAPTAAIAPAAGTGARFTADGIPKLTRRRDTAILGGVAGGIADHLRVPVVWVRLTFLLMSLMAGAGVLAYSLLWIFVPQRAASESQPEVRPTTRTEMRQAFGIAAVGVALLIFATALGFGDVLGWVLGPLGLAALGGAFIWREADDARRARWRRTAAGIVGPSKASLWRLVGGCALVIGGLAVFALGQLDFVAVRSALTAVLLTLVGVAIITIPWWLRLVRDLGDERRGRVQERERAEIAAHLHDSVLQTLALIQRQSADPREVQRLARSQERQLRIWLYGPAGYASAGSETVAPSSTLAASLAEAAGEIEDAYAIAVTPVIVGDAPMDQHLGALVAAAREAMVNAAKHAQVQEVSVYAEVEDSTASIFIRDRGVGFDLDEIGADRRGVAQSIHGRMQRHGGTATIRSTPGEGTEVELTMPVSADADGAELPATSAAEPLAPTATASADPADSADEPLGPTEEADFNGPVEGVPSAGVRSRAPDALSGTDGSVGRTPS